MFNIKLVGRRNNSQRGNKFREDGGRMWAKPNLTLFCCRWTEVWVTAEFRRRWIKRMREENETRKMRIGIKNRGELWRRRLPKKPTRSARWICCAAATRPILGLSAKTPVERADNNCLLKKELAAWRVCHDLSSNRAAVRASGGSGGDIMTRARREVTS